VNESIASFEQSESQQQFTSHKPAVTSQVHEPKEDDEGFMSEFFETFLVIKNKI
jgi:hypothetical protein